jgi:hypothetical protein
VLFITAVVIYFNASGYVEKAFNIMLAFAGGVLSAASHALAAII